MICTEIDLSGCPYYGGEGTCSRSPRCQQEPACITDEPLEGWPSRRAEIARRRAATTTVICGSCAAGDHACGGDCSCPQCTGVINGLEPTS